MKSSAALIERSDQSVSTSDMSRRYTHYMGLLASGEQDRLVVMKAGRPLAVCMSIQEFEDTEQLTKHRETSEKIKPTGVSLATTPAGYIRAKPPNTSSIRRFYKELTGASRQPVFHDPHRDGSCELSVAIIALQYFCASRCTSHSSMRGFNLLEWRNGMAAIAVLQFE